MFSSPDFLSGANDGADGADVTRVWWRALNNHSSLDERAAQTILGRADLNWSAQLEQLGQCGLCGPLWVALQCQAVRRHAPAMWLDTLGAQALGDQMRALAQREALREIATAAREVGAWGVVLKGGALLALQDETRGPWPARACCDLDVYFAPASAPRVHARLIERGYAIGTATGTLNEASGHQLPPLCQGDGALAIEIHQTLLPRFCGLPQRKALRGARALSRPELHGLRVLAPEAMLLHGLLHCSKHGWSHGLKVAYDIAWVCQRFPALNWRWLGRLVAQTGMSRGFWTPLCVLAHELELPVPAWFLARAPADRRARHLQRLARRQLFGIGAPAWEHNPWIVHPLYALQSGSSTHLARHLCGLLRDVAALEKQLESGSDDATARNARRQTRLDKLREAARLWRAL